jgi:type II secretory pathway pseudopilin PulG
MKRLRETGPATAPRGGLTLIEVLIVFVLIAILVAVAIPLFLRSQMTANEVSAIKSLRLIHQAEIQHRLTYGTYATMDVLGTAGRGLITDTALTAGLRNGYRFEIALDSPATWFATASPALYGSDGVTTYCVDESGLIRGSDLGGGGPPGRAATSQWRTVD